MTEKEIRNYIIIGSIVFLLSMVSLYVVYAEALCLKTCKEALKKAEEKKPQPASKAVKFISIIRTDACQRASNCTSNKYLVENYDMSDQNLSGKFIMENGDLKRQKPRIKQGFSFYGTQITKVTNSTIIVVDPDQETMMRSKKIYIEPSLADFVLKEDKKKREISTTHDMRIVRHQVWINPECTQATIGWQNNGTYNLPKVLNFMINDCATDLGITNSTEKIITKKTQMAFCGNDCQYKKFLKDAKLKSKNLLLDKKIKIKSSNMTVGGYLG